MLERQENLIEQVLRIRFRLSLDSCDDGAAPWPAGDLSLRLGRSYGSACGPALRRLDQSRLIGRVYQYLGIGRRGDPLRCQLLRPLGR